MAALYCKVADCDFTSTNFNRGSTNISDKHSLNIEFS